MKRPYDVLKQLGCAVSFVLSSSVATHAGGADDSKFYTVIDQNGHMRSVLRDVPANPAVKNMPTDSMTLDTATTTVNGEKYVDSGYLEKRQFNLDGKKKFYSMPNGLGGIQVVERVPGAVNEQAQSSEDVVNQSSTTAFVTLSSAYARVTADEIVSLVGQKCWSPEMFPRLKIMRHQEVIIWPRSDAPKLNGKATLNFELVEFRNNTRDLSLQSFAPSGLQSVYYWPLPIFLDAQGCVLEGVNGFYQKTLPSTILQPSVLVGTLHVPVGARYLMLTPLTEAIDLPKTKLSEVGQVRLIPLR